MQQLPPTVRLIGIGWYFVVCIVGGLGGGVLLDRLIDSRPILTLIGLLLGLFFAFYGGYQMLKEVLETNQGPKE
ncbi:MAG: AtpZ/AtpI family protein [Chloroflexi bacterium]|nr:AtpZ/AtpI family protein [Chloroflexota bacterium]